MDMAQEEIFQKSKQRLFSKSLRGEGTQAQPHEKSPQRHRLGQSAQKQQLENSQPPLLAENSLKQSLEEVQVVDELPQKQPQSEEKLLDDHHKNTSHEKSHLVRLLQIGGNYFLTSITAIVTWLVLGLVVGDTQISEVFALTYPMQFVSNLIYAIFGRGANIKAEKENNPNAVGSGFVFGFVLSLCVFSIASIFADGYITFFGFDVAVFRDYVIYFFLFLFVQNVFYMLMERLYFADKEKTAVCHTVVFNLLNFCLLIFLTLSTKNFALAGWVTLAVLFVYSAGLFVSQFKRFKLDFNILSNLKYVSSSIMYSIFMFFVYFFGFQRVFSMGEEYVVAVNFVSLCTDAQWDCSTAVATLSSVDLAKGRFEYKKTLRASYLYIGIVISTILVMFFGLYSLYDVSLAIGLVYLAFQIVDMLIDVFSNIISCVTQLDFSPALNTVVNLVGDVIWTLFALFLVSAYCTEIGQAAERFLLFGVYLVIRFAFFEVKDGKLVRKVRAE